MSTDDTTVSLIYVDLIESQPDTLEEFSAKMKSAAWDGGPHREYADYLAKFQPWRSVIRSGDNQEPLFKSTERYFNQADAIHAIRIAFGNNAEVYLRRIGQDVGDECLRTADIVNGCSIRHTSLVTTMTIEGD